MTGGSGPDVRLTVLGSGTLLPDDDRRSACHHLRAGDFRGLLDCGSGAVHGFDRHGVAWQELDAVALTHFHTDHIGDLGPLLFALKHGVRPPRTEPLTVLGPPELRRVVDGLAQAFGEYVLDPGFPVRVEERGRTGTWSAEGGSPRVRFHPTPHTDHSVAHRWEGDGWVVGYTGDTGPDADTAAFLAGADVLVTEVAVPDSSTVEHHLSPRSAAELARAAQPGLLVTTHVYPPLVPDEVPELVRRAGFTGRVAPARDGLVVEIRDGEISVGAGDPSRS